MIVYKKGVAVAEFDVGLGFNGLSDKLHSGDDATPEGRYQITKKIPASRFYKALLINYPNEEDRKRFAAAKQKKRDPLLGRDRRPGRDPRRGRGQSDPGLHIDG